MALPFNLDKYVLRSIDRIYKRKLKAGDIDADLVKQTAETVWHGVKKGWGQKNLDRVKYGSPEQRLLIQFRYNIHVAMAFKNHHSTAEMVAALLDDQGKIKPFDKFKKDALKISEKYNLNYLEAEYTTAIRIAENARKWQDLKRRGGSITWRTQKDGRVRDSHRLLEGTTYPVDHPFWLSHPVPLSWRCRCFYQYAGKDAPDVPPPGELPSVKPPFNQNPGETGLIFTPDMPMFLVDQQFEELAANLFGYRPPVDPDKYKDNLELFQALIGDPSYRVDFTDNLSGGIVFRHLKAHKPDLAANQKVGRELARRGDSVIITEHIEGQKNPELVLNGVITDIKTPVSLTTSGINNAFKNARRQGLDSLVLNLSDKVTLDTIEKGLYRSFHNHPAIERVTVVYKGKVLDVERRNFEYGTIGRLLREAYK